MKKQIKKHGVGRYDYSKVKYINSDTDVIIICHNHEEPYEFPQKPSNHLQGQGCRLCGIKKCVESRKLTLEEFIKISNKVHGEGTYDYSKVVYITNDTDVIIICPKHGEFPQTPSNHMRGSGCSKCKFEKLAELYKLTLEEFIERAKFVHGIGTYDYSKVNYVNMHTDVIITCPKHGDFPQEPASHLQGCGCRFCAIEKRADMLRMTLEEFIEYSNEVHGIGTYDYSKVNYINNRTEVIITCPIHGDFPQTPSNHLQGQGCSFCKGGVRLTTEEFIKRANKIHGEGTFDYSEVNYVDAQTEVIIICPIHGGFPQTPNSHLNGNGCSKCNNNKGENAVRNFLTTQGIEFEEQKSFEGCKYKKSLRFDFYIPQYNLCIESDGKIHF